MDTVDAASPAGRTGLAVPAPDRRVIPRVMLSAKRMMQAARYAMGCHRRIDHELAAPARMDGVGGGARSGIFPNTKLKILCLVSRIWGANRKGLCKKVEAVLEV